MLASVVAGCRESLESRFIYYPSRLLAADPSSQALDFREVDFAAADGVVLHGVGVFMYDYRGYGRSKGTPSETGLVSDAIGALAALVREGVAVEHVVYFGRSLGAAVTVDLALAHPPRGVVLESPFASVRAMANGVLPGAGYLFRTRWDSREKIGGLRAPLLLIHGERDEVVPFAHGQAVFAAAPEPKTFVALREGGHYELEATWSEYWAAWRRFLGSLQLQQ